ncbi:MAG: hypothetical protein M1820_010472 [Bogoriella megaspora]|nr:MAG: hypothetical protein M1820_010472 [Bogoriella megaspora]
MESLANAPHFPPIHDSQSTKQLSNEELCQEADGLFAGITYLNQTEQIEDNVVDVDDDDDENEEVGLTERPMVPDYGMKISESVISEVFSPTPTPSEHHKRPRPRLRMRWSWDKCLSSCQDDDDCCRQSQQKTSTCPVYLLSHWIEVDGQTRVISKNGKSLIWLCPVPSCGFSFTSRSDLLRHIRNCDQIDTLTDVYWCNARRKFESGVFYGTCGSCRHRKSLDAQLPLDFKVIMYKLTRSWSDRQLQPDPQFCPRCEHSKELDFYTPEEVIDHVLYHQTSIEVIWHRLDHASIHSTARSIIRNAGRYEPVMAGILDQAETRTTDYLILKFTQFLETQEIEGGEIWCGYSHTIAQPVSNASKAPHPRRSHSVPSSYRFDDMATTLEHFRTHHAHPRLGDITVEQRRRILADPRIHRSVQVLEEMKLRAQINHEKRRYKALLGRTSLVDKSDKVSPQGKQWANLRNLRFSSSTFHSQILSFTDREGRRKFGFRQRAVIRRLRQQIKSSSEFLVTGILTFRGILHGLVPSTLEEVLAFVSLSHVMFEELCFKGSTTKPLDFNTGFPHWMRAIRGEAERAAFQELATCLWPGSGLAFASEGAPYESIFSTAVQSEIIQAGLQNLTNNATELPETDLFGMSGVLDTEEFPEVFEFSQSVTPEDLQLGTVASNMPLYNDLPSNMLHSSPLSSYMDTMIGTAMETLPYFRGPVQELLGQSHASDHFQLSDVPDIRPWEDWPGPLIDLTPPTPIPAKNSEANIIEMGAEAEVGLSGTSTAQPACISESPSSSLQPKDLVGDDLIGMVEVTGDKASGNTAIAILCATVIFQIVLSYMNYVCGLGDLLTYFAGNPNMRRRAGGIFSTSSSLKENSLQILVKVLHPLLTHHELEELKSVVGVTSAALQQGFFACLREVEDYLVHLGRFFARSKRSYMVLISKSLKYMGSAALASFSSTSLCPCGTDRGFYTGKEIKAREAEQARWASDRFSNCHGRNTVKEATFPTWTASGLEELSSSSNTTSSFDSIQTGESNSSSTSGEAPASAFGIHIAPLPALTSPAVGGTLHCDTCSNAGIVKGFNGPDAQCNLRRHVREKHEGKKFRCPSCGDPSPRLHNLRTHWKRKHKGVDMPASLEMRPSGRHASHRVSPY